MAFVLNWRSVSWDEKDAEVRVGPFLVRVRTAYDNDYDWTEGRGRFSARFQEGAVKSPWRHEHNTLPWFLPEETLRERIESWLQEEGCTIQMARKRAVVTLKEDMAIARDGGAYEVLGVIVTVSLAATGTELAEASTWGIEVLSKDDAYIDVIAQELIATALLDAENMVQRLQEALREALPD